MLYINILSNKMFLLIMFGLEKVENEYRESRK